jgi:hypothetical protein
MNNFKELDFDMDMLDGLESYDNHDSNNMNSSINTEEVIGYKSDFEERTTEYYKTLRFRKMDPISNIDLNENNSFKFPYMWDPYTGERKEKDPYGPLYFDPDALIHYYYLNRLKNLWNEPVDENGGFYEGYYDMLVGIGDNINIVARGECPEKYLFRIPIIDCYLEKDYNKSFITMGPILSDEEAKLIDEIAKKNNNNYKLMFKKNRPSIYDMKKQYDIAISKNPDINQLKDKNKNYTDEELNELKYKASCNAVDKLKSM